MAYKKIALVTGANRGIGFETVRQLAERNIHVLLGARNEGRGKEAEAKLKRQGLDVSFLHLDVDDLQTHHVAAEYVKNTFGKLDILVNNAGIVLDEMDGQGYAQASRTSLDVFRKTFETNFFNLIALTQTFVPLIKESEAGRIVFLSSLLGSLTHHGDPESPIYNYKIPAYDCSKTALNAYTVHLAHELKDTAIKVNAAHPGSVKTDMNAHGEIEVERGAKTSVELATLEANGLNGKLVYLGEVLPW